MSSIEENTSKIKKYNVTLIIIILLPPFGKLKNDNPLTQFYYLLLWASETEEQEALGYGCGQTSSN